MPLLPRYGLGVSQGMTKHIRYLSGARNRYGGQVDPLPRRRVITNCYARLLPSRHTRAPPISVESF